MTLTEALTEWYSKRRRMGCVAATNWLCMRVEDFYPERLTRFTSDGDSYQHVLATNGIIRIDLAPYNDMPT